MKYYFYKKEKKEIVPVEDEAVNSEAKARVKELLKSPKEHNIPSWILSCKDVALFQSKGNLDKANARYLVEKECVYDMGNTLNDLPSKEWLPETVTVFAQKGLGAGSSEAQIEKQHPAPYSYQDVARHIRFFTKEGDFVLDPFVGVGSTLKAACVEGRRGLGIELNPKYAELSQLRIETELPLLMEYKDKQETICGDSSTVLRTLPDNTFDFVMTSPPYWNILDTVDNKAKQREEAELDTKYSESENDLANIPDYKTFLIKLTDVFIECARVLKNGKYIAIVVSDFRKSEKYYMFHSDLAAMLEERSSFVLKGIKILYQRHKSIYPYGYPFSFVPNVHHQYVLILRNEKNGKK